MAVEADDAAIRRHEPGDHVEDRRLAGAVGAEQPHRLALAHVKRRVLHDGTPTIAFLQTLDREDAAAAEVALRSARRAGCGFVVSR
jgi:hypothetical protein